METKRSLLLILIIGFCALPKDALCHESKNEEEADIYCPPEDDPENLIFHPSKIQCDWYYLCVGGKPYKLECAPGYHWNQAIYQCDLPQNVKCEI